MPTLCPGRRWWWRIIAGSMAPVNGTVMRGWVEKPSSVLMTSMSWQSLTRTAQSGLGRLTRRNVALPKSATVWRLLGNGLALSSSRTDTPSAQAVSGTSAIDRNG